MTMLAVVQHALGGADTLELASIEKPIPQEGQLLVRVKAVGVNRADVVQREGRYPAPPGASAILGVELAGVVEEVRGASRFRLGDAVFGLVCGGAYAEYAVLDEGLAMHKPDFLSWVEAASLPEVWMTAWFNLVEIGAVKEGEGVLIHAGASGVGLAAIQLARLLGARPFASASNHEKLMYCRRLGAEQVFNGRESPGFSPLVRQWGGADLILDPVGGSYLAENIASLNQEGRLLLIGVMGGGEAKINLTQVLMKRLTVRGSTLRAQALSTKARLARALEDHVLSAIEGKVIRLTVDKVFPLQEVRAAHAYMEKNHTMGKILLTLSAP